MEINRILLIGVFILSMIAIVCLREISHGRKHGYYGLGIVLLIGSLITLVDGLELFIFVLLAQVIMFALFTRMLKVERNGHSLYEQLR